MTHSGTTSIKLRLETSLRGLFKEYKEAKVTLIGSITKMRLTGTFGESHINEVKRLESVLLALPVIEEAYLNSEDFKALSSEAIEKWAVEIYQDLVTRERNLFTSGLSEKSRWKASGVMQAKYLLAKVLNFT